MKGNKYKLIIFQFMKTFNYIHTYVTFNFLALRLFEKKIFKAGMYIYTYIKNGTRTKKSSS